MTATPNTERKRELLSIVVPCYNEEDVLVETLRRMDIFCAGLVELDVELIFVDDGSHDRTREILKEHAARDDRIKLICFARNFGHQIAVTAGMDAAGGNAVVLIDADLQDPPEIISQMIEKWKEGYDVVYGRRTERLGESAFKLATARGFYRLLNKLSDVPIPLDTGDFRLMSRRVVDTLRAMPERDRFVRGMVSWVGFRQVALPYKREERFAGESKYPLRKMIRFAIDGILSFSTKPLQLSVALGMLSAALSLVQRNPEVSPWFPMLLLMYPVWETMFSIYRRLVRGVSPGVADALHFHQLIYRRIVRRVLDDDAARRMLRRNSRTSPYLWAFTLLTVVPALLFWRHGWVLMAFCVVFVLSYVAAYLAIVRFKVPSWFQP